MTLDPGTLLAREAQLLDDADFDAWLALYTQDALYHVPARPDAGSEDVSIVHADLDQLGLFIARIRSARAHAPDQAARTVHCVGSVLAEPAGEAVRVRSALTVDEFRAGDRFRWAARVEHDLVRAGETLAIARKTVRLVDAGAPTGMITFLF